ncbi:MAG TPA: RbsD/FucU domain-containing protein [Terracidiphilus sp.]|nr:RbsD/FucU domain-containing protein [Terracidiphilus sp.]
MADAPRLTRPDWERELYTLLPLYGHRNWIVVADSAYPAQSKPGIETIVSGAGQIEVARKVLDVINASRHVRANVYLDKELEYVSEADAPGAMRYRQQVDELLKGANKIPILHEQIIAKLDQVSQVFRVLIIKTDLTIPYTTVFFELGCAYWPGDAEDRMRKAMAASGTK